MSSAEIFSNYDEIKSKKVKEKSGAKREQKEYISRAERTIQVMVEQDNMRMAVSENHASCWVHKDLTVTTKQIRVLLTAARTSDGKDECQVRLTGIEQKCWMGTEINRLEDYGFRGSHCG